MMDCEFEINNEMAGIVGGNAFQNVPGSRNDEEENIDGNSKDNLCNNMTASTEGNNHESENQGNSNLCGPISSDVKISDEPLDNNSSVFELVNTEKDLDKISTCEREGKP